MVTYNTLVTKNLKNFHFEIKQLKENGAAATNHKMSVQCYAIEIESLSKRMVDFHQLLKRIVEQMIGTSLESPDQGHLESGEKLGMSSFWKLPRPSD